MKDWDFEAVKTEKRVINKIYRDHIEKHQIQNAILPSMH